ncbi:hypothetical protein [Granulicella aggregans]|uniref:hypothetical protein n=1 Tax=Granulicella aggregans TaxID=474949 RepID=UPI0021E0CA2E|nr:hypothetical protein [Granulicella aggregans]
MRNLPDILFLAQFAATLFMTGLIWFVQIVHYPLFASVHAHTSSDAFRTYENSHANRTSFVVFPPMAVELLTALAALFPRLRPAFLSQTAAITSAVLVLAIWASTGLLQVPLHNRLAANPTAATIRSLVLSNWLRTALWTARAILLTNVFFHAIH